MVVAFVGTLLAFFIFLVSMPISFAGVSAFAVACLSAVTVFFSYKINAMNGPDWASFSETQQNAIMLAIREARERKRLRYLYRRTTPGHGGFQILTKPRVDREYVEIVGNPISVGRLTLKKVFTLLLWPITYQLSLLKKLVVAVMKGKAEKSIKLFSRYALIGLVYTLIFVFQPPSMTVEAKLVWVLLLPWGYVFFQYLNAVVSSLGSINHERTRSVDSTVQVVQMLYGVPATIPLLYGIYLLLSRIVGG